MGAFKNELNRITDYVTKLAADTKIECDKHSNDVKFWAEYRTGIKEYSPWLAGAEKAAAEGLSKPSDLNEVKALHERCPPSTRPALPTPRFWMPPMVPPRR